jgi:cbb3-type cytochrome oxidase subunit 1
MMYYFVPGSESSLYSSIIDCLLSALWSLIFYYIWAGPHHLLYSVLLNQLGAKIYGVFSIVYLVTLPWYMTIRHNQRHWDTK